MPADSLAVVAVLGVLGVAGVHVWYGFMLSKVFRRLGADEWRAWVPIVNEAEIFRLGGVPPWSVIFWFVPVVALYAVYLKATAASRIGAAFGRGRGSTVLAILLPPVWATVLAGAGAGAADAPARGLEARLAASLGPDAGYAFAVSTPTPPERLVPPPPGPQTPHPAPAPGAHIVPPPDLFPTPAATPAEQLPSRADIPSQPWAPLGPAPVPVTETTLSEDELDRTVVVGLRPGPTWQLIVEGGPTFPLSDRTVIVGRQPTGSGAGGQRIEVPDATRTLSKVHARLELADGVWTVTDLDATNGVIVTEADGSEVLLDSGGSAVVTGRFMLGKVAMRVSSDAEPAAS